MPLESKRKIIGSNIAARRRVLKMIQEDLAQSLGTSRQRIARIEEGRSDLLFEEVPVICEYLSIDDPLVLYEPDAFI